jgi:ATP-binding cassette subfamily B protein/subfamily B ATP-binding cassette protein MsbA
VTNNDNSKTNELGLFELCSWSLGYAIRRKWRMAVVLATIVFNTGLEVIKPWPMVFLIDYVLRDKEKPALLNRFLEALPGGTSTSSLIGWCVAATILIFLLGWAVELVTAYTNISWAQRMVYDLAGDLFARLQELSLKFHTSRSVGDNIRRVTADCSCISTIVKDALLPVLAAVLTLVTMFVVMWRVDQKLTVVALLVVPWLLLVFRFYAEPMMERSYAEQDAEAKIYDHVEQTFAAIPIVQAFTHEEQNDARFRGITANALAATLSSTRVQMEFKVLIGLATAAGTAAILWLGAQHALSDQLTVGKIVLFLSYLGSLYAPLESIMYSSSTIQGASGSARRVWEVLKAEREVADKPGAATLSQVKGHVEIENVSFSYRTGEPVLRGISLKAQPGDTVAFVGATGAGKTTLASLIPRFFDPASGRVLLDGMDVRDVKLKSLRSHIALVLQEAFLFPLSIAENIAYANASATMAEIEAAARAANAHDFIVNLPQGYHTVVGERGATLSGGERQRISIARALLKNAPVLIMDEPTSALDAETENLLLQALGRLTEGRTTFIIAHRLSTIRRATRIVVLKDGQIGESGTHEELLARNAHYARFYQLQSGSSTKGHAA